MAIASLSKFTVPLASDQSAANQGLLMPKLSYRFRVMFENFGTSKPTTELTKQVTDAVKPKLEYETQDIWVYNSRINLAGRGKWGTMSVKIRDDVTGAVSKLVGEQMQKQFDFFEQSSAASGGDYKFLMRVEVLDGGNGSFEPQVLETWECYGCFLTAVDYGAVAYADQKPMMISLTIQPDNCIQTSGGASAPTGRNAGTLATGSGPLQV